MNELSKTNIIRTWLMGQNYHPPDDGYDSFCEEMMQWYKGDVEKFHHYSVFNGIQKVGVQRHSLGMAKVIAEDYANLLLNEKVKINISGGSDATWLDDILQKNDFTVRANNLLELAYAVGTGALVEYLGADGSPVIDYIQGGMIYPLKWDMQHITECAFASQIGSGTSGARYYVQLHTVQNGTYHIKNVYLDENGKETALPDGVKDDVDTRCTTPTFQIIRPNIVNSYDLYNPMGMSVYGTAVGILKATDLVFDAYVNEFDLGRTRLLVPISMAKIKMQEDGTAAPLFDSKDLVFYAYQTNADNAKPEAIQPQLRIEQFELGVQRMLNMLAKKCGLGNDRYQFDAAGVKTATEVISEKSELYQSMKKHEILLRSALIGMTMTLAQLSGRGTNLEVDVDFDDSIIEDRGTMIQRHIDLTTAKLESKLDAIKDIKHCDDAEAKKILAQIAQEDSITGTPADWFGGDGVTDDSGTATDAGAADR